jgi:deoxyribodipyrimidine photo-lyase
MYEVGLFIFHRDLRIVDNVGLIQMSKQCKKLICCFIFTPEQVSKANSYRSSNAIQFMMESLQELQAEIRKYGGELYLFYGKNASVLRAILNETKVNIVGYNKDYSPYALSRDEEIRKLCNTQSVECLEFSDYYLFEPGSVLTGQKGYYKKYTPFYEEVMHHHKPEKANMTYKINNFSKPRMENIITLEEAFRHFSNKPNKNILVHGGRTEGLRRLHVAIKQQKYYSEHRDNLTYNTTFLSAYIKFGCVSIREVYEAFHKAYGKNCGLLRELIWREFFASVLYGFPEVVGHSYQPRYKGLKWNNNNTHFNKWKNGVTGYPIVDAGMRQLNKTGYMHNRLRMMTASFLIKVLLIDWRWGEKYFAQQLTDYDIASNNGNWQGISGTGVDMKPYFRDMNPYIQSLKFDKNAEFIKFWVPELADVLPRDIHKWNEVCNNPEYKDVDYPKPIVDYYEQKEKMLALYKNA